MIQTSSVKVVNDGTELRINQIRQSDLSNYTCVARNSEGRIHQTVSVVRDVRDPPTIKLRPDDEYFKSVGENVTFPCSASGSPAPTISWRRTDGSPLPKKRHKEYQGTLTISGLQKKDHGIYECVVSVPDKHNFSLFVRHLRSLMK